MKIINVEKKIGGFVLETGCVQIETGCIHGFIGSNGSGENYAGETDHGNPGAGQRQDRLWRSYHEGYHHDQPEALSPS